MKLAACVWLVEAHKLLEHDGSRAGEARPGDRDRVTAADRACGRGDPGYLCPRNKGELVGGGDRAGAVRGDHGDVDRAVRI